LLWQCKEGHQWEAVPHNIKRRRWCPFCAGVRNGTIEGMQGLAKARGGKCLSKEYINRQTKLTWQCEGGHQWQTAPSYVRRGHWCPTCAGQPIGTIEDMQKIGRNRGGQCLSREYTNSQTKLSWQCKEGHQWEALPGSIKNGTWCPVCAGTKRGSIEGMQEVARRLGGECLSQAYINSRTKLTWQCKKGHLWKALPSSIKQGHWCPTCPRENKREHIRKPHQPRRRLRSFSASTRYPSVLRLKLSPAAPPLLPRKPDSPKR
jgi:hypothetical protein